MSVIRSMGARPSPPDVRDYPLKGFIAAAAPLPRSFRLPVQLPIYNQGNTDMCVDFSIREIKELQEWLERGKHEPMANGYIYASREPDHWQGEGMFPREALETLLKRGIPPASVFNQVGTFGQCTAAYLTGKAQADEAARPQRVRYYVRCNTAQDVMTALAVGQSPVLIATAVTQRFAMSWLMPDGSALEEPKEHFQEGSPELVGYHAMMVDGYLTDDAGRVWLEVQNSWGTGWGNQGRCRIPVDYPGLYEMWSVVDSHPVSQWVSLAVNSREMVRTWWDEDGARRVDKLWMDAEPVIKDGRTFVPLRAVSEAFGAEVWYSEVANQVGVKHEGAVVTMEPGVRVARVNDTPALLDVAPWIDVETSRTMVPLRFLGEAFGFTVEWNQNNQTITIMKNAAS